MVSIIQALQNAIGGTKSLNSVPADRGWWPLIREPWAGAWQRNVSVNPETARAFHAIFACETLIAGDIAKLRLRLVELTDDGVWVETTNSAYSPVLRKPNAFQTRQQFVENWILSKLSRGNTYVLKHRDERNVVSALYVLDPTRVKPLVSDDGAVFYQLDTDNIAGLGSSVVVPAREIIHDRFNCLHHPLVGVPPIYAAGLAATHGLAIANSQAAFFQNGSRPGGLLTAPGKIDEANASRLKEFWQENFGGNNIGKIAVLGDGLAYTGLSLSAEQSQLIEQLRFTSEVCCSVYHVPTFMVGLGPVPALGNVESLTLQYYAQCLQSLIEAIEACLDDGLGMGPRIGVEFDLSDLLRMDGATKVKMLAEAVGGSIMAPNEARRQLDLPPVDGGASPMAQQQDFSLAALAERDRNKPFAKPSAGPAASGAE